MNIAKKPSNRDGYNRVIEHFSKNGQRHGAKSAIAKALGCTRAAVAVWEKEGIPIKHVPKLKKLTGLKGRQILPELVDLLD